MDGDGLERSDDSEENKILMRKVASESIVLLRNEGDVLPFNPQKLRKVAIIGPNAKAILLSGGGSAILKPNYFVSPYDGIVSALEQVGSGTEVTYSEGARGLFLFPYYYRLPDFSTSFVCAVAYKMMPSLDYDIFTRSGERGWIGDWYSHVNDDSLIPLDEVLETILIDETRVFFSTSVPQGITRRWTMKLRGYLKPRAHDCTFEFGLIVAGRAKVHTSLLFIASESDDLLSHLIAFCGRPVGDRQLDPSTTWELFLWLWFGRRERYISSESRHQT